MFDFSVAGSINFLTLDQYSTERRILRWTTPLGTFVTGYDSVIYIAKDGTRYSVRTGPGKSCRELFPFTLIMWNKALCDTDALSYRVIRDQSPGSLDFAMRPTQFAFSKLTRDMCDQGFRNWIYPNHTGRLLVPHTHGYILYENGTLTSVSCEKDISE